MQTKACGAAVVAVGLLTLAGPSAASAQAVPDANCTSTPSDGVIGQPGNNRGAQTFTAQNTGALTRAQVEIDKIGSSGDWILSINAVDGLGTPTNTVLGATTIPDVSVPDGVGTLTGDFASPATVTAGQQYAVVFTRPASDTLRIRYSTVNPCPGFAFLSSSQTDPFDPVCGGPNDCDLIFAVFVTPPVSPSVSPSNAFTLGAITRNNKKGTATITMNVPNPGELTASGNGVQAASAGRALISKSVAAGQAQLLIRAKGKKKQKLNEAGKVKLSVAVTYTPTGGDPATQTKKLKLKKKLSRR